MRHRTLITAVAAGMMLAALPAHASTQTLDGKKTKVLHFTDTITAAQDNDKDITNDNRTACKPPRCARFTFIYKPAKGVKKAPFSVRIAWTYPVEDFDLWVVETTNGTVAQCAGGTGTSELAVVSDPAFLLPGHKYTVIIDHYRALPDTVNATVQFPTTEKVPTTAPAAAEKVQPINCTLSTS